MSLNDGVADLHMHTTASDGTCSVAARCQQASERDLDVIAITDHDCIDESLDSPSETRDDVEVVTGVEVRAGLFGTKIELLGYFVDPDSAPLTELLERVRGYRRERNREMVQNIADVAGVDTTYEELAAEVDGALGRPHMADLLVEEGVVDSVGEAFGSYLATGGECYVQMERAPYDDVLDAIHAAGGAASLAHPGRIRADAGSVSEMVETLADEGLDGIEAWYPYGRTAGDDDYADVGVEEALDLAEEYDLIPTGGSDCHGPDSGKFRIGEVRAPRETVGALRDAANVT